MSKTYKSEYKGRTIETFKSEGQEYVQKGQFCYYRKATDWGVKIDGKLIDRGLASKKNAVEFAQRIIDRQ